MICALVMVVMVAVAPLAGADTATFSWEANSENDLAGYKLYQSTVAGQYGAPTATLGLVTGHALTLPTLEVDQRYYFTLTAFNQAGKESAKSSEVSKLIVGIPIPRPGIPVLTVSEMTQTSLTVSWPYVDDGKGQPAMIDVRVAPVPISWGSATSMLCTDSPCVISGLMPGTPYEIQAVSSRIGPPKVFGQLSAVVTGTTLQPDVPLSPKGLTISKSDPGEIVIMAQSTDCPRIITSTIGSTAAVLKRTVRCMK